MQKEKGFTLLELMIAVAIIGILAAIAVPNYQRYLIKSNRSVAQSFMLSISNNEEQYMLDNRSYTTTLGAGGLGLTPPSELNGKYTFALGPATPTTPPSYIVTATAIGSQASDGNLTLDNTGAKTPPDKW